VVVKRKYNDGCAVDQQWIFALYDRNTKLGYIELVNDRSAQTLIPIIQKFIRPETKIFSNQWPAYRQLHNLGYDHKTVNHSENFVDPQTGTCTNTIEAYWSRVKRNVRLHWLSREINCLFRLTNLSGVKDFRQKVTLTSFTQCFV